MASRASGQAGFGRDDAFFPIIALVMAAVIVGGFSMHLAMGRSTFASPLLWHLHGVAFMAWVALFVIQSSTGTGKSLAVHRRLGWIGAAWSGVLVVLGIAITIKTVRDGTAPFFFQPQHFLIANPLTVLAFAGLTAAAVKLRRRTDWHRRLHVCGMAALVGPGVGRLLPLPLMGPYAYQIALVTALLFPVAGMIRDRRKSGTVHPAWLWGTGTILLIIPVAWILAFSPIGDALYAVVTDGGGGAGVPGRIGRPSPLP